MTRGLRGSAEWIEGIYTPIVAVVAVVAVVGSRGVPHTQKVHTAA